MRRFAPLLLAALPAPALAQSDDQLWLSASASGTLSGPVKASVDTVARYGEQARGPYQWLVAPALGYALDKDVTLWVGYVHSTNATTGKPTVGEHRTREDLTIKLGRVAGGIFATRLRSEQRWRDGARNTGTRGRLRVSWTRPLRKGGRTALVVSHESFVNFDTTDWGQHAGYERMRNAVALSLPVLPKVKGDIGYLAQHVFVRGGRDASDHVATFALALSF